MGGHPCPTPRVQQQVKTESAVGDNKLAHVHQKKRGKERRDNDVQQVKREHRDNDVQQQVKREQRVAKEYQTLKIRSGEKMMRSS